MTTVVSLKESDRKEFNCALALSPQVSWLLSSCMTSFGLISDIRMSAFAQIQVDLPLHQRIVKSDKSFPTCA